VDGIGTGSCPVVGFHIISVESLGSATTVLVRWILGRSVVRMEGGWNWHRIMSNGGILY
jgi:hypothetical protein